MTWLLLVACTGCTPTSDDTSDTDAGSQADDTGDSGDTGDTGDTGVDWGDPVLQVDVVVIGAGPAGLAAAWEAEQAGASVVVLEMSDQAGGAGWYARNFMIVGSEQQQREGIDDSPERLAEEWPDFANVDPDATVTAFAEDSWPTVKWLVDSFGARVDRPTTDYGAGRTARIHRVEMPSGQASVEPLVNELGDVVWLEHRADALVEQDGAVVGAGFTDLVTGEQAWIQAGATIVATGGFSRDLDRVLERRPELEGAAVVFETWHGSNGAGHHLLEDVGAAWQNDQGVGTYVHAVADYRDGMAGEALWVPNLQLGMLVDLNAERVANEQETFGFGLASQLEDAPDKRLFMLVPGHVWTDELRLLIPSYNDPSEPPATLTLDQAVAGGVIHAFDDVDAAAAHWGMDPDTLSDTTATYDGFADASLDADFGKEPVFIEPFGDGALYGVELVPGVAKSFTGFALDDTGRVLDDTDAPIPGLYAAGEVCGMLGSDAAGQGFSGSITAVYWTGRRAGEEAASAVLGE